MYLVIMYILGVTSKYKIQQYNFHNQSLPNLKSQLKLNFVTGDPG